MKLHQLPKRKIIHKTQHIGKRHGGTLLLLVVLLSIFGLVMIFNVSSVSAMIDFDDKYHYAKEQFRWIIIGFSSLIFFSLFDYRKLYTFAFPAFIASLVLLIAVFIRGIGLHALGASRWLDLGFVSIQPSEFVKLTLILYLAAWFSRFEKNRLTSFLLLLLFAAGPVLLQPDLGSAVIIVSVAIAMYFASNAPMWQFFALVPTMIASGILLAIAAPYRFQRLQTFLNPDLDPQGTSYHVRQILIALGSGGVFGVGLGKSRQKFAYLPEVSTDSIFAIIGEELGFVGATFVLLLLLWVILECMRIAKGAKDSFGSLLATGLTTALAVQIIINLGAMVSLLPLTGIPLPFISYGGSSLIVSLTMVGILINIARSNSV